MSLGCAKGQVASRGGLGGAERSRGCRAAAAASSWPAGRGEGCLARCCGEGSAWRGAAERAKAVGASVSARARGCNTRALGASRACTEGVRRNVVACYRSPVSLASHRTRL